MAEENRKSSAASSTEFTLAPLVVSATLLPRFARRLRILAAQEGRTADAIAAEMRV